MPDKALVLGGGGPVGGAWLTGMLAGLTEAGVDLDAADVLIGTSMAPSSAHASAAAPRPRNCTSASCPALTPSAYR